MSDATNKRRALAEISYGSARNPVVAAGNRPVHHYWSLLAPHFRGVLLAPQRRSDDRGVAWSWREEVPANPVTAPELADLRKRLSSALATLREDPAMEVAGSAEGGPKVPGKKIVQAATEVVAGLISRNDAKLAAFACRTETGPMIHSWGAAVAAAPFCPDNLECSVGGNLLVGEKDPAGLDVFLENRKGLVIARTKSDATGAFEFKKVGPGSYRVRVVADRVDFPVSGLEVEVGRTSVTGLELRSTALNISAEREQTEKGIKRIETEEASAAEPAAEATPAKPRRWRRAVLVGMGLAGVVAAGWWVWPSAAPGANKAAASVIAATPGRTSVPGEAAAGANGSGGVSGSGTSVVSGTRSGTASATASGGRTGQTPARGKGGPARKASSTAAVGEGDDEPVDAGEAPQVEKAPREAAAEDRSVRGLNAAAVHPAQTGRAPRSTDRHPAASPAQMVAVDDEDPLQEPASGGSVAGKSAKTRAPAAGAARTSADNRENLAGTEVAALPAGSKMPAGGLAPWAEARLGRTDVVADPSREAVVQQPSSSPLAPSAVPLQDAPGVSDAAADGAVAENRARSKRTPGGTRPAPADKGELTAAHNEKTKSEKPASETRPENETTSDKEPPAGKPRRMAGVRARNTTAESEGADEAAPFAGLAVAVVKPVEAARVAGDTSRAAHLGTGGLIWRGRVRASAWRNAMLRDAIVPTKPVTAGEDDALELLRERMFLERRDSIPATIGAPRTFHGFTLVLSGGGRGGLRWRNATAAADVNATTSEGGAEIGWQPGSRVLPAEIFLESGEGLMVARVVISAEGVGEISTAPEVRAAGWIAVECAPADLAGLTPSERALRFGWRTAGGAPVPEAWQAGESAGDGGRRRIEFPLLPEMTEDRRTPLAFHDQVTGWSMQCEIQR